MKKIIKRKIIPPCGLCGLKKKPREKTECCGNWVCGDESDYELFSYSRDICVRNHRRFTLCGYHHAEDHKGDWKICQKCLNDFKDNLEMYVWYGTNEYNFEKLKNPPKFKPTYCAGCSRIISLSDESYTSFKNIYVCQDCSDRGFDIRAAANRN